MRDDQITDKLLAAQGHGPWESRRMPDPVRVVALANAVELFGVVAPRVDAVLQSSAHAVDIVVDMAQAFEVYLTGEEADGQG